MECHDTADLDELLQCCTVRVEAAVRNTSVFLSMYYSTNNVPMYIASYYKNHGRCINVHKEIHMYGY